MYAMKKNNSARRNFIKLSVMGIGGITMAPVVAAMPNCGTRDTIINDKKLHIVCVGAHPGDPEFGCGGTMAKYSDAGHRVTFLYLTRGEASDPHKTYAEMAALRTMEAAISCKVLNATAMYAGQVDGNTVLDKNKNEEMTKMIVGLQPDIVFTQWPVDAHPDHQVFAHKTQNPVETYNDYFKPLEEFRGLQAGVKAAEAFIHFKAKAERANIIGI